MTRSAQVMDVLTELKQEFQELRKDITDFKVTIDYCANKIDDFSKQIQEMDKKMKKVEKNENEIFIIKSALKEVQRKLNTIDHTNNLCNVEIRGIPEKNNENLLEIIDEIAATVELDRADLEINNFYRIRRDPKTSNDAPPYERVRPIIVKFNKQLKRDNFLAAVKTFNMKHKLKEDKLNTTHLKKFTTQKKEPIFISEHLTTHEKNILRLTKRYAKDHQFAFAWTRNGRCFLRKSFTSKIIVISHEDQLSPELLKNQSDTNQQTAGRRTD